MEKSGIKTGFGAVFLLLFTAQVFAQGAGIEWDILIKEVTKLKRAAKYDRAVTVAKKALEVAVENACFGRFGLATWQSQEADRLDHYRTLHAALGDLESVDVYPLPAASGSPFVFPISLRDRSVEQFGQAMEARGAEVRSLMGGPIVDHPAYQAVEHDGLVNCRALAGRSCFVGIHQTLPSADVAEVASLLRHELKQGSTA